MPTGSDLDLMKKLNTPIISVLALIAMLVPAAFLIFHKQAFHWSSIWEYRNVFINGWLTTIGISLISFVLSVSFGLLTAFAKHSKIRIFRYLATLYVEIIRGTPLLVQILFFFYVFAAAIKLENRYIVGILTLSLFAGAYLAEIFRAGIESISSSQLESAKAIGLTNKQTYRYVIFPQAFRITMPPLSGQLASLIKDSSLLSVIGISEFTYSAQQVNSATYSTLESFLPLGIGYLLLTLPISLWSKYLERKYRYET